MKDVKIDILIPTYEPNEEFGRLLDMLKKQTVAINKIIIMNTLGTGLWSEFINKFSDDTKTVLEIHNLSRDEFNHGATRNAAVKYSDADYFICMTQDAIPADEFVIENLMKAFFENEKIKMAYARQLPKENAGDIEKITRAFNYPDKSVIKTKEDIKTLGIKAFFASNVCCAYEREIFDRLGGFINKTDFNEDMMYASKLIRSGFAIKYCADAKVYHSHNYSLMGQFKRNKAVAESQKLHPEYFGDVKSEGEGIKLVKTTAKELCKKGKWYKVPELIVVSGFKYLGYLAGKG